MPDAGRKPAAERFDVVIVGARCAGAALAQRLAAAGLSVALLDAAKLPSDQRTSTHLVQPPGMDELDTLGVGDSVRRAAPALGALRLSYDGNEVRLPYQPGRAAYCLRREQLDLLLQRAAVDAGAELRPETRVLDVVRGEGGRIGGVVVRRAGEATERLYADLVVGADGRNSTVAKLVGAEEYLAYDGPRSVYWAYWQRPSEWNPHEFHNSFDGEEARIVFPTDADQLLIATVPSLDRAQAWREDHSASYLANIRAYEPISSHLGADRPLGEVRGVFKPRYFFRASAGPGWALIGDAGHHKEFVVGLGISDALRDARGLAGAVLGSPGGAERWWRRRDAERIEMFHWSRELGRSQAVNALQRLVMGRLADSPDLPDRFAEIIDGRLRPYDLVPDANAGRWIAAALLRGHGSALPPLIGLIRRRERARRDVRRYRRLLRRTERGGDEGRRLPTSAPQQPAMGLPGGGEFEAGESA
jgi:flavin-dependent dehydrogenase